MEGTLATTSSLYNTIGKEFGGSGDDEKDKVIFLILRRNQ